MLDNLVEQLKRKLLSEAESKLVSSSLNFPKQEVPEFIRTAPPSHYQFEIIEKLREDLYLFFRGLKKTVKKDRFGSPIVEYEKYSKPLLTELGANRIIDLTFRVIGNQYPFGIISEERLSRVIRHLGRLLTYELRRHLHEYIEPEARRPGIISTIVKTVLIAVLPILTRSLYGQEISMYYGVKPYVPEG